MPVARHETPAAARRTRPRPRSIATTPADPEGSSAVPAPEASPINAAGAVGSTAEPEAPRRAPPDSRGDAPAGADPDFSEDAEESPGLPPRPSLLARILAPIGWLLAVLLIAAGAAGMVAGVDHPPGTPARAELTWETDRAVAPAIDAVARDLTAMSLQVEQLSDAGRRVLVAVAGRDPDALAAALANGTALEAAVVSQARDLHGRLEGLPVGGAYPALTVSPLQLARHKVALEAVDATQGIEAAWAALVTGATIATRLGGLLVEHDAAIAKAAGQGVAQDYVTAVTTLDGAKAVTTQIRALRNQLSLRTNVSTLDQWIQVSATYEEALQALYQAFVASRGRVTQEVARAYAAEQAARARLPPDGRSLVVIMAELSQGGLNQAVIAIDTAGQGLAHALESMPDS